MKRWKMVSAVVISGALLATNLYLIMKEDSKVSRSIFVKDWAKVEKSTVTETYDTKGVTTSAEDFKVYFNGEDKVFQRFLVKEGDVVTAGTPLYEYTVKNLEQQTGDLEREITELEGQIASIDEYIQKLTDYQMQVPDENTNSSNVSSDFNMSTLDKEIYKQELEKSRLEERKTKLDAQLTALNEQSGPLTMDSEVDGIVKKMDDTLGNPVMTIASSQQAIEGVLSEYEYKKTKVGMNVKISSPDLEKTMNGTIGHVENYPTKEPSLDKESLFSFQALMKPTEDESKTLVIGSKVDVMVTTDKANNVPTVPAKIVHDKNKPYLYKLTDKGYVNKEYISPGVQSDKKVEIVDGPIVGDRVLISPRGIPENHSKFITPIHTDKVAFSAYDSLTTREKWRYFLVGILEK